MFPATPGGKPRYPVGLGETGRRQSDRYLPVPAAPDVDDERAAGEDPSQSDRMYGYLHPCRRHQSVSARCRG